MGKPSEIEMSYSCLNENSPVDPEINGAENRLALVRNAYAPTPAPLLKRVKVKR